MEPITYKDFAKVEFRIGEIIEAKDVTDSEKLIRMIVDFGPRGQKVVFSGIKMFYNPKDMIGKKTVFVVNMVPKKIMDEESEAMIFASSAKATEGQDPDKETLSLLLLDKDMPNGSEVY